MEDIQPGLLFRFVQKVVMEELKFEQELVLTLHQLGKGMIAKL